MDIDTYPTTMSSHFYTSSPTSYTSNPPPQSRKRRAPAPPSSEPLAKRLENLAIRPALTLRKPSPPHSPSPAKDDIPMDLDTSNTVYVHSLSSSESDSEPEDTRGKLIFIPDIERELSRIPREVLRGPGEEECRALVLYRNPVVAGEDQGQRKAILAARRKTEQLERERGRREEVIRLGWKEGFNPTANGFGQMGATQQTGCGGAAQQMKGWNPTANAWGTTGRVEEMEGGDEDVDMDAMDIE